MYCVRWSNFILLHVTVQFSQHHLLNMFSLLSILGSFVVNQLTIYEWVHFYAIHSIFMTMAWKSGNVMFPPLFFLKIALETLGVSWFHTKFKIVCSFSVRNAPGILIEIALNLYNAFDSTDILIVLIPSVHEHGISFHLFVSLITFISVLHFSVYRSCTFLVKFIHTYFILFDAIVNGIVFLISF